MPKRPTNRPRQKATPQRVRKALDAVMPEAVPTKPAPNKAKPPKPVKKLDLIDIERADSEGMAQPQGLPVKKKSSVPSPSRSRSLKSVKPLTKKPAAKSQSRRRP